MKNRLWEKWCMPIIKRGQSQVSFQPDSEYEFEVDGAKLYECLIQITLKL